MLATSPCWGCGVEHIGRRDRTHLRQFFRQKIGVSEYEGTILQGEPASTNAEPDVVLGLYIDTPMVRFYDFAQTIPSPLAVKEWILGYGPIPGYDHDKRTIAAGLSAEEGQDWTEALWRRSRFWAREYGLPLVFVAYSRSRQRGIQAILWHPRLISPGDALATLKSKINQA